MPCTNSAADLRPFVLANRPRGPGRRSFRGSRWPFRRRESKTERLHFPDATLTGTAKGILSHVTFKKRESRLLNSGRKCLKREFRWTAAETPLPARRPKMSSLTSDSLGPKSFRSTSGIVTEPALQSPTEVERKILSAVFCGSIRFCPRCLAGLAVVNRTGPFLLFFELSLFGQTSFRARTTVSSPKTCFREKCNEN